MEVTVMTWIVSLAGLVLITILIGLQLIAVFRPHSDWTVKNIYGGEPKDTDPKAYFAFNQGYAWADSFFWGPIQLMGSVGMLLGKRWRFLLALIGAVSFWYSAINIFIWDREMGFQPNTVTYWVLIWGIWPIFALFGGGVFIYSSGLIMLSRIFLKKHNKKVGRPSAVKLTYVLGTIWIVSSIAMIVLAIMELNL